jgi:hypothetical protein
MRRLVRLLVVCAVIVGACSDDDTGTTTITSSTTAAVTTTAVTTTVPINVVPRELDLIFPEVPLQTTTWTGPEWPTSLDAVAHADAVPASLTARLVADGFAIDGTTASTHLAFLYDGIYPYGGRPVFVTTDAVYHHWHLVFDRVLREVEEGSLLPVLERLTGAMVEATRAQRTDLAGTASGPAAARAAAYWEAAATLLELDVGAIDPLAQAEVDLVLEHTAWVGSPTIGGDCATHDGSCVDYSLMTPRGHYTRTEDLTRYFRAMSLLGNTAAAIFDPDALWTSLLIARALTMNAAAFADWETIYLPTAFLVGDADDYTPLELVAVATSVAPFWGDDPGTLDAAIVAEIGMTLPVLRPVGIDPQRASVRTMGSRFVIDSWIYDQVSDPAVPGRTRVTPLDVAAALGSDWAYAPLTEVGFAGYPEAMAVVRAAITARTAHDWGQTAYDAWLYALQPMWLAHDEAFPPFMRGDAWTAKAHQTGLGSYAELKHDTILYAKQGMAEGDMEPPPEVTHWVEPDPTALMRLASTARLLRDGLNQLDLLRGTSDDPYTTLGVLDMFIEIADRLAQIARQELTGDPISAEDNEFLGQIGGWFTEILYATGVEGMIDDHGAIVADIFLDALTDTVLEVGTGDFNRIYVIVPDDAGGFEVATGGVYAYYEFWQPRTDRLTDEAWWLLIEGGTLPDRPWWVDEHLGL